MKAGLTFAAALLALAASAIPAYAHHSFAAEFDANQPVRLTGKITRIEWTNPHTYFYIDVTGADGKVTNWSIEGASPGALSRRAWSKGDLKLGDTVTVEGYRAKSGANVADGRRVTLPDGRALYGGSPGDGGPGDNGTDQGALPAASK
ncbi:MAG: DUF6152 family protein [Acidobacteriaceae bacterium]|jgi:hypothetical protein